MESASHEGTTARIRSGSAQGTRRATGDRALRRGGDAAFERLARAAGCVGSGEAVLLLADGTCFYGRSCGASGEVTGEVCFNTSLVGYQEILTDPSYAGQIVTLTYPQIGSYGVNAADAQAPHPFARGLVVRELIGTPSGARCAGPFPAWLAEQGIVAIEGIDTRALAAHIRDAGAQMAILSTEGTDRATLAERLARATPLVGANLVAGLGRDELRLRPSAGRLRVAVYDCGAKESLLAQLEDAGCSLALLPWDAPASQALRGFDGVFLSNGPGDPEAVGATAQAARSLLGETPIFGICLGHQMLALAAGGKTVKLPFGHRGGNHPVMDLESGSVEITSQNHGFAVDFPSLGPLIPEESGGFSEHASDLRFWSERRIAPVVANPVAGRIRLTHVNLNDGTCEGLAYPDARAFSVQYHPESSPGPWDSRHLFARFVGLMGKGKDAACAPAGDGAPAGACGRGAAQGGALESGKGACHA